MFKIYRHCCCGLDVHKTWIYATIGITDEHGRTQYIRQRFSSFKSGLDALAAFLLKYNCTEVCMESSGVYWKPVKKALDPITTICWVAHPKYTKPRAGEKSDIRDSKWICDLFMCDMIRGSFIPPEDIELLRTFMRYRKKLISMRSSEKCRALNCLTVSSIKLDDVFSDVFGKSSRSIIEHMLEHPGEHFDVTPFLNKRCKHSAEEVQEAIDALLDPGQAAKLRVCLAHMDEIDSHIAVLEANALAIASTHADSMDLLKTIPGLGSDLTAATILAEIGDDMSAFPTAKHLTSWTGTCPRPDSSAKKVKRSHISKAGTYVKPVLVQVANGLIKSKDHPEFVERYRRLKARHGHQKAIIAVCRMLVVAIWHVLHDRVPYTAEGYLKERITEHSNRMTTKEVLSMCKRRGIIIVDEETDSAQAG